MEIEGLENYKNFHDRLVLWCNYLLEYISSRMGEEAVGEALNYLVEKIYYERFKSWVGCSADELLDKLTNSHQGNFSDFEIAREKDRYEIIIHNCGSGGLINKNLGRDACRITSKPYDWAFNHSGVLYYCGHASLFNKMFKELNLPIFIEGGTGTSELPCKYIIYR